MEKVPIRSKERVTYLLLGVLLFNLMPVVALLPIGEFLQAVLLNVYAWPAALAESMFNYGGSILLVGVPFWAIVGGAVGHFLFRRSLARS
jgi:hypothetical protein